MRRIAFQLTRKSGAGGRGRALSLFAVLLPCSGCFSERYFFMQPRDFVPAADAVETASPRDTREWLPAVHGRLSATLPKRDREALLTEDLVVAHGRALDVWQHFDVRPVRLHKLFGNFRGLMHTAQSSGADPAIERPADPWPGFQDVWIPVREGLQLSGRLGLAQRDGKVIESDCIVIIPGLLGDLAVKRSRTIAEALVSHGLHALALELRGYGQTEARYPEAYYTFGVLETGDLLAVSEWLEDRPEVCRTGLMGFCWGANHVLLAAWEDGRSDDHPSVSPELRRRLRPRTARRHYAAGIMAFSPCLRFEEIIEQCEKEWSLFDNPVLHTLQEGVRFRKRWKGHPDSTGSVRTLIHYEFARSELHYPNAVTEGLDYLRLMPFRGRPAGDKLESARMPVLIVQGANDPLAPAQDVADFFVGLENRRVAGLILPGGGHVGFAAYCRPYFYSLILSFFDPVYGPAALQERAARKSKAELCTTPTGGGGQQSGQQNGALHYAQPEAAGGNAERCTTVDRRRPVSAGAPGHALPGRRLRGHLGTRIVPGAAGAPLLLFSGERDEWLPVSKGRGWSWSYWAAACSSSFCPAVVPRRWRPRL